MAVALAPARERVVERAPGLGGVAHEPLGRERPAFGVVEQLRDVLLVMEHAHLRRERLGLRGVERQQRGIARDGQAARDERVPLQPAARTPDQHQPRVDHAVGDVVEQRAIAVRVRAVDVVEHDLRKAGAPRDDAAQRRGIRPVRHAHVPGGTALRIGVLLDGARLARTQRRAHDPHGGAMRLREPGGEPRPLDPIVSGPRAGTEIRLQIIHTDTRTAAH